MPPEMQRDLIDPYAGGAWLWLIEVNIPGYSVIRLARNTEDVVYDEHTFTKHNFDIGLQPSSGDGSVPQTLLRIAQDADYTLEDKINATQGAAGGTIKVIRAHEDFLDNAIVELEKDYDILTSESDTEWVIFVLGIPSPLSRRIPLQLYSSKICPYAVPTLFKGVECQYSGADLTCTGTFNDCYEKGNANHWGGEIGLDPNTSRV